MQVANRLWRMDSDSLAAYVEDREVITKIRRSYPDFTEMARYYREGSLIAIQYRVPSKRKRSARNLLGVNVDR
ncbi:hypothetical protein [Paenibacillus sp. Leaf72]|uniref:hypothetical protein n=1 Tax=Paenibacillus sp. Leaf72 TaxID=1736234 RepID=UPI0006FDF347|nr:hypothetical protein [Paenibacillus sp. Leaf72]KQN97591.1 hypothetical protein ASF12_20475 [Paenibacillus sp. Leaf72]